MRIHRLEVEGFRSLKKISWEPGALNVVIGPNGSGKSNLLQVLWLMHKAAMGELYDTVKGFGGSSVLSWDARANTISVSIDYLTSEIIHGKPCRWSIELDINNATNSYSIKKETLESSSESGDLIILDRFKDIRSTTKGLPVASLRDARRLNESFVSYDESNIHGWYLTNLLWSELYGSRVYSTIDTTLQSPLRQSVVTANETTLAHDGSNLIQVLHTLYTSDRHFEQDVNSAMAAAFGVDYDKLLFPPASDHRVQLRIRWKSLKREQSALDISDGTLRFLYLLAILANPNPSPLIAIDEPETGLHPSMFRIIAELAQECSRKSQVIFTTHSPQFLDSFGDTPPTTTVAQWKDGETVLKVLDGERLATWLKEYSMGQLFTSGELEEME